MDEKIGKFVVTEFVKLSDEFDIHICRIVSLGIFAIVFILVKNVHKARPSFVPVPSVETLKNIIMVRRDRKGPIIPLWDEEKRLCGVQTNSGK